MIAFCGVWFMAETAKVLNPDRIVVVPDREASCSLVDACPVEPVREFRRAQSRSRHRQLHQHVHRSEGRKRHPLHLAQRGANRQFHSRREARTVPAGRNLGNYVRKQTGRENMQIWQGTCIVHATFPARRAGGGDGRASRGRGGGASRNARKRCWRWPISSAPRRPSFSSAPPAARASSS